MGTGCILTAAIENAWLTYLTWGIMVGIGVGTGYAPTATTVSKWFVKQKGLAMGIVVSGLGLGTLAFAPLSGLLIDWLGWRCASLFLGLIIWTVYLGGALVIRRDPQELGLEPLGARSPAASSASEEGKGTSKASLSIVQPQSVSLPQAIRDRKLWMLFAIHGFWVLGMAIPLVHLVPYATDIGSTAKNAALMQAMLGGMSVLGRVALGVFTERVGTKASLVGLLLVQMGSMIWLIMSHCQWMLWVFTVIFGLSYGGLASVFPLMTEELFGLRALGAIFGLVLLGATVGGTIGPILAGFIFDSTNAYWGGFLAGSVSMGIGAAVSGLIASKNQKQI